MSWREREFSHESEACYRSLDQIDMGAPAGATMGGHAEDGMSVIDWYKLPYRGRNVRIDFLYLESEVLVRVEGLMQFFALPNGDAAALIGASREMALKLLKEEDERPCRGNVSDHRDRGTNPGGDLPIA